MGLHVPGYMCGKTQIHVLTKKYNVHVCALQSASKYDIVICSSNVFGFTVYMYMYIKFRIYACTLYMCTYTYRVIHVLIHVHVQMYVYVPCRFNS